MDITSTNSTTQVISSKRIKKKRFDPATLPHIDPHLISIATLASRFIDEIEDAFTTICNAPSNDGREVTVLEWFPCARKSREYFTGERVETDGAFNILLADTFNMLLKRVRDWHVKLTRAHLTTLDIIHGKFKVAPPIEIQQAVRAFALNDARRDALTDMLYHSMRNPEYSAVH
jgi:hypothetical protein